MIDPIFGPHYFTFKKYVLTPEPAGVTTVTP